MGETFGYELNNSVEVSTTQNMTYIDAIFTPNILNIETLAYVSYFSYHEPLLSITTPHDDTYSLNNDDL